MTRARLARACALAYLLAVPVTLPLLAMRRALAALVRAWLDRYDAK